MLLSPVFLSLLCLGTCTLARYVPADDYSADQEYASYREERAKEDEDLKDYYDPPHYTYEYKVDDYKSGDLKRHRESRQDGAVEGYYSFLEADGSLRTVHYTADDKHGFNAVVTRTQPD